ncbi:hypothetical protein [Pseudomonas japonica]|uniref:Lipoprotein n=1 Tax=Pseudomonas japonica TaxID=256466 RepID=A0A239BQE0_9PSED|nr:hypothetical protein [Pseudomonas japonica]SNS10200.1 hypothetical protein SAMN05444352_103139 [Pseudomonas japonica]
MDRCAIEFIARRWWRRVEVWMIAGLLIAGGAVLGWQSAYWSMASTQAHQVDEIRKAYDVAMEERDRRLEELTRRTENAAATASDAATTATQAADRADEALNRVSP